MPRWEHAPTHCNKGAKTTLGVWHVTFLSVPLLARACPLVCECYTGNISAFDGGAKIQTNGSFVQAYLRTYTTVRESFFFKSITSPKTKLDRRVFPPLPGTLWREILL